MKINGEIKLEKGLTLENLKAGECFVFTDNEKSQNTANLFFKTDLDIITNLNFGDAFNYYDEYWENRPVKVIEVELNIL